MVYDYEENDKICIYEIFAGYGWIHCAWNWIWYPFEKSWIWIVLVILNEFDHLCRVYAICCGIPFDIQSILNFGSLDNGDGECTTFVLWNFHD